MEEVSRWLCVRLFVGIIASEHVTVAFGGGMPEFSKRFIFMSSMEFCLVCFISKESRYREYWLRRLFTILGLSIGRFKASKTSCHSFLLTT